MPNPYHEPAGSSKGGQFTSAQLGTIESSARLAAGLVSRTESDFRGIRKVSWAPQGTPDGSPDILNNKKVIEQALDKINPDFVEDLDALYVTGGGLTFLGAAQYYPVAKERGYVSDEINLADAWMQKSDHDKQITLLHEIGHRVQLTTNPEWFKEFKKEGLGTESDFLLITDSEFSGNYPKSQYAGETFAQTFALNAMDLPQPTPELEKFWSTKNTK